MILTTEILINKGSIETIKLLFNLIKVVQKAFFQIDEFSLPLLSYELFIYQIAIVHYQFLLKVS